MEIGVIVLFILIGAGVWFVEGTKLGKKFAEWGTWNFFGINPDTLED